jgi:ribonuclease HI
MSSLLKAHPLSKAIMNARVHRVKRHTTRINDLIWTFNLDPSRIEKVEAVRYDVGWKAEMGRVMANTKEAAIEKEAEDKANIKVYTDGSGVEGKVGASAVLKREGIRGWKVRRFNVGKAEHHEVFEGEAVGLVLAMELVRGEKRVREVSIYMDNQAAITATGSDAPGSARHIIEMIHAQHCRLAKKHARARVTIHWIPSHSDVLGNEKADKHAKRAAKGEVSSPDNLPACLRKALPISKAAMRRLFRKKLTEAAAQMWAASPRHLKFRQIDPTLSIASFRKIVRDMPKCQSAILVQLRTGHIALNKHLNRIGKADSPVCPCCMRDDKTVHHFLLHCPAHAIARRALGQAAGQDANYIQKLLSNLTAIPHLLKYVGATKRFARQGEG